MCNVEKITITGVWDCFTSTEAKERIVRDLQFALAQLRKDDADGDPDDR